MVHFDYYGEGLFVIKLFRDTATECNYPDGFATNLEFSEEWEIANRDDYVLDTSTSEYENAMNSIRFNACLNNREFGSLIFSESNFDPTSGKMVSVVFLYIQPFKQFSYATTLYNQNSSSVLSMFGI